MFLNVADKFRDSEGGFGARSMLQNFTWCPAVFCETDLCLYEMIFKFRVLWPINRSEHFWKLLFLFNLKGISYVVSYFLLLWTRRYSTCFIILESTFTMIIFLSIWGESEICFAECNRKCVYIDWFRFWNVVTLCRLQF